jgi:hypothetical protein
MAHRVEVRLEFNDDSWFDRFVILVIFLNSLSLAMYDYADRDNLTPNNMFIESTGMVFTVIFTFEAVVKIISMGFIYHPNAYLKDGWNWIDFTVVIIG